MSTYHILILLIHFYKPLGTWYEVKIIIFSIDPTYDCRKNASDTIHILIIIIRPFENGSFIYSRPYCRQKAVKLRPMLAIGALEGSLSCHSCYNTEPSLTRPNTSRHSAVSVKLRLQTLDCLRKIRLTCRSFTETAECLVERDYIRSV